MSDQAPSPAFRRAYSLAYGLGTLLCVVWPLVLQGVLGTILPPGSLGMQGLAEELGYTFTGLVVLGVLFVRWRFGRIRTGFAALDESRQVKVMTLEILLYAAIFELSALFGLVYYGMGGPERYARSFIGLATAMFLVFVPRMAAWRQASQK